MYCIFKEITSEQFLFRIYKGIVHITLQFNVEFPFNGGIQFYAHHTQFFRDRDTFS